MEKQKYLTNFSRQNISNFQLYDQPTFSGSFSSPLMGTSMVDHAPIENRERQNVGGISGKRKYPDSTSAKPGKSKKSKKLKKAKPTLKTPLDPSLISNIINGYPPNPLNEEQKDIIVDYLANEINRIKSGSVSPRFDGYFLHLGVLKVRCLDIQSKNWLAKKIKDYKPWDGADLQTVGQKFLGYRVKISICVPGPIDDPIKVIRRIQWQNEGIDTTDWKLAKFTKVNCGYLFIIIIGERSWSQIVHRKKLCVNFSQIGISVLKCKDPSIKGKMKKR